MTTDAPPLSRRDHAGAAAAAGSRKPGAGRLLAVVPFRIRMALPTIAVLLLVVGFPLAYALYVSAHEYDLTEGGIGPFVRAENFHYVINLESFQQAARNTITLTISVVLIELLLAL